MTLPEFLTKRDDGEITLAGHRIGLYHVVHFYNEGYSPEMLAEQFPMLPLALIHKVIAFYLENKTEVDHYSASCQKELAEQRAQGRHPDWQALRKRFETLKQAQMQIHSR